MIVKNNVGGYEYNATVTLQKQINRVLKNHLFEELVDGMVVLDSEIPNTLTEYRSNATSTAGVH